MPSRATSPSRAALVAAFAAIYVIWGSTYLGIRVAVESIPPFLMAGARFLLAGSLLFAFLRARGAPRPSLVQWREQAFIGFFLILGGNGLVSWAEQRVASGITTLILGASPLIVVLLDWIRPAGRKPDLTLLAGVAVGLFGIAVLLGPGCLPPGYSPPGTAVLALLGASLSWWIGSLWSKHSSSAIDPMIGSSMQMACGGAAQLVTGALIGEPGRLHLASVTPGSWAAFTYLVVAGSLIAYPIYVWLLKHSTAARVSTYAYVNPVVAVLLGWAVLKEPLNGRIAVAGAIIVGAVALITIRRTRPPGNLRC